jgi:hypothetical protein
MKVSVIALTLLLHCVPRGSSRLKFVLCSCPSLSDTIPLMFWLLIASLLNLVAATKDQPQGSTSTPIVDLDNEEQSGSIWPPFEMCVVGVYVLVHIFGDVFAILKLLIWCSKGCERISAGHSGRPANSSTSAQERDTAEVIDTPVCDAAGNALMSTAATNCLGSQNSPSSSDVRNSGGSSEMPMADLRAVRSSITIPCKCVNEPGHICALSTSAKTSEYSMVVPTVWTTAEGFKYHIFEHCTGQNNVGLKQCRAMCSHCLRKRNKQL